MAIIVMIPALIRMVREIENNPSGCYTSDVLHGLIEAMTVQQKMKCISVSRATMKYINNPSDKMKRLHELKWLI